MDIYVPWQLPSALSEIAFAQHPQATRLISYSGKVHPDDAEGIIRFLLAHKEEDGNVVYLDSEVHVAAATLERISYSCVSRNFEGEISIFSYKHNLSKHPSQRLQRVFGFRSSFSNALGMAMQGVYPAH